MHGVKSSWQPTANGDPQGSALDPCPLNIFLDDQDEEIECIHHKFLQRTPSWEEVLIPLWVGRPHKRDLDRSDQQAQATWMKMEESKPQSTSTSVYAQPFLSQAGAMNSHPLKFLEPHFWMMTTTLSALAQTLPCCTEMGSSVQANMLILNFSQSIQSHLLKIRDTMEQSINK